MTSIIAPSNCAWRYHLDIRFGPDGVEHASETVENTDGARISLSETDHGRSFQYVADEKSFDFRAHAALPAASPALTARWRQLGPSCRLTLAGPFQPDRNDLQCLFRATTDLLSFLRHLHALPFQGPRIERVLINQPDLGRHLGLAYETEVVFPPSNQ